MGRHNRRARQLVTRLRRRVHGPRRTQQTPAGNFYTCLADEIDLRVTREKFVGRTLGRMLKRAATRFRAWRERTGGTDWRGSAANTGPVSGPGPASASLSMPDFFDNPYTPGPDAKKTPRGDGFGRAQPPDVDGDDTANRTDGRR